MKNLVVYCHNIQGLAIKNLKKNKYFFRKKRCDIIVLCETKCTEKMWIEGTSRDSKYYASGYKAYISDNGQMGIIVLIRQG